MALSNIITFELDNGVWKLQNGSPAGHKQVVAILYGHTGREFRPGDGDTVELVDLFAAFGFVLIFSGGVTDPGP